jgi:hypothetical protein
METEDILDILRRRGIESPYDDGVLDFPEVAHVEEGETVYGTTLGDVEVEGPMVGSVERDDRLGPLLEELERARRAEQTGVRRAEPIREAPPEPHCAWYCPIHFFGPKWGIYIRERCIIDVAADLIHWVDWKHPDVNSLPLAACLQQLLRGGFYFFYLHEHFHHKVESLGLRLLITTNSDLYRPYKGKVYRPNWGTSACLEESLANAESHRRLGEKRYSDKLATPIRSALRHYLKQSFKSQPPGYREGGKYLSNLRYRPGLHTLQSQVLEATLTPKMKSADWEIAPGVIGSLMDITDVIYVVLPAGARPIFPSGWINPVP